MANRIANFFKEVIAEVKKVDWPDRQTTLRYTAIVIGISVSVAAFLGILDKIFWELFRRFII